MEKEVQKVKNILVPTDFSDVCEKAIYQAVELVKGNGGIVNVLHVIEEKESPEESINALSKLLQKFEYKNIVPIIKEGDIFSTINDFATEIGSDIIIMATHGKKGIQKLLGSNALKVVDSTKIPVMVVQDKVFENGFKNILFPVSLNDEDRQKTSHAIKLAKMFDSKIHIYPRYESSKVGEKQMINTILQIKAYLKKYSVDFEVAELETSKESFNKKVIAYSEKISADLILIVNDASNHLPVFGGKEEAFLFNELQIPVMCIEETKAKRVQFSTAG